MHEEPRWGTIFTACSKSTLALICYLGVMPSPAELLWSATLEWGLNFVRPQQISKASLDTTSVHVRLPTSTSKRHASTLCTNSSKRKTVPYAVRKIYDRTASNGHIRESEHPLSSSERNCSAAFFRKKLPVKQDLPFAAHFRPLSTTVHNPRFSTRMERKAAIVDPAMRYSDWACEEHAPPS